MDVHTPQTKIGLGQLFLKRKKSFTVSKITWLVTLKKCSFCKGDMEYDIKHG